MTIRKTLLGISLAFLSLASLAERTITDQLNRSVTIPDKIERAVILQHQTLNIATQLDAMPQVVGVLAGWKKRWCPKMYTGGRQTKSNGDTVY